MHVQSLTLGKGGVLEFRERGEFDFSLEYVSPNIVMQVAGEVNQRVFRLGHNVSPPFSIFVAVHRRHYLVVVENMTGQVRLYRDTER
jgi:hypothetical protein